jgi:hypothetical protein
MTYTDLVNKVYFLTATNSTSFPAANMVIEINNALDRVVSLILHSDGRWAYDDSNNTDLPITTTDLVQNQQDYSLSVAHLEIARAEVQDSNGNWLKLEPLDLTDVFNQSLTDFLKTASLPVYYDKIGTSVFLYPKPNYAQTASLKLWIDRGPNYFVSSDTTKVPGFNALYHELCALWPAYNFALANGRSNATQLLAAITAKEDSLKEDYALRAKDDHPRLKARPYSFR